MPHGKIIIVLVAVLFVAAVLRCLERPRTAIVDHPVVTFFSAFWLTTPIGPAFLHNLIIQAISTSGRFRNLIIQAICGPDPILRLFGPPRPAL